MNELIKIQDNNGKQAVSARELYECLGLNKTQFARWAKKNITGNQFAIESEDWTGFDIVSSGNEAQDFALSIEFAKKLAMMARTPEGEKIRDYFIEVERKYKEVAPQKPVTILDAVEGAVKVLRDHDTRILAVESRQKAIEQSISRLDQERKNNEKILFDLPISEQPAQEVSKKDQIRMLVAKFSMASGVQYKSVYDALYSDLYYRYHINLRGRKRNEGESWLDVADRVNCLEQLHAIISDKVKNLTKRA